MKEPRLSEPFEFAYYMRDSDSLRRYCKRLDTLFDALAHGDEQHRAWLKQAIADHLAGRPVQPAQ